jgi:hypothetical protein
VKMRMLKVAIACLAVSGCATAFMGSPHVEGGRQGCETKCRGQGMTVAGMVYMGEYSSACVCAVPESAGGGHASLLQSGAAATGGAVAVELTRRQQQQQMMMQAH